MNVKMREVKVEQKEEIQKLGRELKSEQKAGLKRILNEVKRTRREVRSIDSR